MGGYVVGVTEPWKPEKIRATHGTGIWPADGFDMSVILNKNKIPQQGPIFRHL